MVQIQNPHLPRNQNPIFFTTHTPTFSPNSSSLEIQIPQTTSTQEQTPAAAIEASFLNKNPIIVVICKQSKTSLSLSPASIGLSFFKLQPWLIWDRWSENYADDRWMLLLIAIGPPCKYPAILLFHSPPHHFFLYTCLRKHPWSSLILLLYATPRLSVTSFMHFYLFQISTPIFLDGFPAFFGLS